MKTSWGRIGYTFLCLGACGTLIASALVGNPFIALVSLVAIIVLAVLNPGD